MKKIKELIDRMVHLLVLDDDDDDGWIQNALYKPEAVFTNLDLDEFEGLLEEDNHVYQIFMVPVKVEVENVHMQLLDLCVDEESFLKCIKLNTKYAENEIFIPGPIATFQNLATPKYIRDLCVMADCYFAENSRIRVMAYEEQDVKLIKKDGYIFVPFVCKSGSILRDGASSIYLTVLNDIELDDGIQILSKSGKGLEGICFEVMDLIFTFSNYGKETVSIITKALAEPRIVSKNFRNCVE